MYSQINLHIQTQIHIWCPRIYFPRANFETSAKLVYNVIPIYDMSHLKQLDLISYSCTFEYLLALVVDGHIFSLPDLCLVHYIPPTHLTKLWSRKMWENMWVFYLSYEKISNHIDMIKACKLSLTVSLHFRWNGWCTG